MAKDPAAAERKILGTTDCPNCGYKKAQVRQDKRGKLYVVCDECDYQGFARSSRSTEHLRKKIHGAPAADPAPAPAPSPAPESDDGKKRAAGEPAKRAAGFFS